MVARLFRFSLLGIFLVVGILMGSGIVVGYCWDYDDDQATCDAQSDCIYRSESWGGWCEELNCWSLSSTECSNDTIMTLIGRDCQWKDSNDYGWCQQTSCWSFKSTNESYCENSTANGGLNCEWSANCYGWNDNVNCWDLTTSAECGNISGCSWGECMDIGCWNYWNSTSCANATGSRGDSCVWDSTGSYCYEPSCWDYGGSSSNVSYCENDTITGLDCVWIDNYYVKESCEEKQCWHYDYTNETYCEDSSVTGMNCTWDGGQYCMMQGCWNYNTEGSCDVESSCSWETSTGGGWCEEVQCWSWDSWNGGNESQCVNNSDYGDWNLTCAWDGAGCYPDIGDQECANFTSERDCMDTYYCWWIWDDWNNVSAGGNCENPDWGGIGQETIFAEWNPGCYIFDMNSTDCGKIIGCDNSTTGACDTNSTHLYNATIDDTGLNCTMINDSQLCNNIPALSTCCEWSDGTCQNKLDKSCWENADREQQELGVTACEDVSMQTSSSETGESLCQQIAGYPLFMPCAWNNSTNTCSFKSADVFGNRTQSFALIDNKKNCDASGGKWIQEWYCEGNRSIPAGRCEQRGSDERNCDKACFACDYDFNGANHTDAPTAKEYCYGSKLGYCGFTSDTSAPNGFGLCRAKEEFVSGVAGDCKTSCGSCTYLGNPSAATYSDANPSQNIFTSYDICNTPKCYCEYAKEFSNVNCKWVSDSTSSDIGGYCVDSSEKTCADACDRCYSRTSCLEDGRGAFNSSGSCSWSNSDSETDGACTKIAGGDGVAEICWDGVDNDNDNAIDCADSECYSDSFCGFVSGDCFGWMTQATCEAAQLDSGMNCTWVTDPWGSWCDFPGMDCWKYDGNQSGCGIKNASCDWSAGTGDGWCEQDWSMGQDCYNLMSESTCDGGDNCTWTNDTWCEGDGADNDWCTTQGGWCDPAAFAPKGCWQRDNTNSTYCENLSGCYYEGDWCMEQGCWNYDGNSTACDNTDDCSWQINDWQNCEIDWSANCWQYDANETYCNSATACAWRTGEGWEMCDNKFGACWDLTSSTCSGNSDCVWCDDCWDWNTETYGMCEAKCFNGDLTSATCGDIDGCRWMDGWCNSDSYSSTSGMDCWNHDGNETACGDTTGCRWKDTGWCNPKGFVGGDALDGMGGGAVTGMECWKYDGNESACTNSSLINMTCAWMQEYRPFCEPDWSADCWKYYDNTTADADGYVCGNSSGCYWTGDYCSNVFDECWNNIAYYNDTAGNSSSNSAIACNANANCNWTMGWGDMVTDGWCEPDCFAAGAEGECTGSCRWMNGFCNTPGMYEMFGGMEMGAPVMIAMDTMGDSGEQYTDLMGAGMKDMDDSFGFASGMANFADAGICNGEKIGFGAGMGNSFGQGNATVKYYVYLDTDGSTTGNCKLNDDSSASGYEFFFSYESTYNETLGKATETFSAQRCSSTNWVTADISLSAWKEKMCGEVQGPMIAVKKSALEKFPVLYDSAVDMRVYVASAGADNNASSPSDTAGPGWVTPGAIDFPITGFFELGADMAVFEKLLLGGGFVQYEDCFNAVDDNDDGLIDCADWNCEFAPHCSAGDRAADTSMPIIDGVKVEEYYDAALIMYNTNKPTNGTLTFYGNDSTCSTTNATIYDLGVNVSSVRTHKLWHYAKIYNDSGVYSLDYPLSNDTTYYYKLKVCDSAAKCGVSACTSFRTAESSSKCGYCNFVTIISPPTGWTVSYDLNSDGTYEHVQGSMCGPSAGMKTSYVTGRRANVKLNDSNGAEMVFLNVTLTKTGLTRDTRTISTTGDLIYDTSLTDSSGGALGMVGMASATRDKIINNLHPEVCKIKMPNDDCTDLYHCDNEGDNCVDITSSATGVQSGTSCIWTIPYCEF